MTSAQQIIEAAFARSTASDAGKLAVDGEMVGHLNRKYQSMHAMMAVHQPDNALASSVLTFSGSPPSAALPTDIINVVRVEQNSGARAYLVPAEQKDRTIHLTPGVYRQGNSLITLGRAGDPIASGTLKLYYTDAPASITGLSSTLDPRFPVRFENVLVLDLAVYLSIKDEGRDAGRIQVLKAELEDEYGMFKILIGASNTAAGPSRPVASGIPASTG